MSQNSLVSATSGLPGLTLIQNVNAAHDSLARMLSGPGAPTAAGLGLPSLAGVVWHDTNDHALKIRDQADTAWIVLGTLDEDAKTCDPPLTLAALAALGVSPQPTFRDRLVNGRMRWDQEHAGAAVTLTAGAALAYVLDQWYAWASGANLTGQRVQLSDGTYRYRFTGAAGNTGGGFAQRVEVLKSCDLAGRTATLQIAGSSTALTSLTWTAYYANSANVFGTLASPTRTQIATGTFVIGTAETVNSVAIAVPSAATTGIEIDVTFGALGAGQTLTLGNVQLEAGSSPTALEVLDPTVELLMCKRYFYRRPATTLTIAVTTSGYAVHTYFAHPVEMFAVPAIALAWTFADNASNPIANPDKWGFDFSLTSGTAGMVVMALANTLTVTARL